MYIQCQGSFVSNKQAALTPEVRHDTLASGKHRLVLAIPVEIVINKILTDATILIERCQRKNFREQDHNITSAICYLCPRRSPPNGIQLS